MATSSCGLGAGPLPPAPSLSSTQQSLAWLSRPYALLDQCRRECGPAFVLDLGSHGRYAVFSRPEAIRTIFTAPVTQVHAGKGNAVLAPLLGPRSLLLLEEDRHLRERRLLMPAFHGRRVEQYAGLIRDAVQGTTRGWAPDREVTVRDAMQEVSLAVILKAVFGLGAGERARELTDRFRSFLADPKFNLGLLDRLGDDVGSPTWRRFTSELSEIDRLLFEEVSERRNEGDDRGDVLGMLLATRYEDGSRPDDAALRDELMTLLVTGHETTATALAWAVHWLHARPATLSRLREEVAALYSDEAPGSVAKAPYLTAVVQEALRLHPILPVVARQLQEPLEVGSYLLPAGMTAVACVYLAHHEADVYEEPDQFVPERFLSRQHSPYEYLPFGGGARRCLGMALALFEMKVVLAALLARFDLEPLPDPVRPVRRAVTVAPSGGTRMRVLARTGH